MARPEQTVGAFLDECRKGKPQLRSAIARYFSTETIWENVGIATTVGVEEALAFIAAFEESRGAVTWDADMLAVAVTGDTVMTERIDHLLDNAGKRIAALRILGVFEVREGMISHWRDYLDTAGLQRLDFAKP